MANKRIIQSAIFEDEFFGELTFFERLLWIGMFTRCADDQGRMLDKPIIIRSQVFPYDDIPASDIHDALDVFSKAGKIIRYSIQGKSYIQIVKWFENQEPQWAMPSKYPPPDGWKDRIRATYKGVYRAENWPDKQRIKPGGDQSDDPPGTDKETHLDNPPGQPTLIPDVAGHNLNLNLNLNHNLNPIEIDSSSGLSGKSAAAAVFQLYENEIAPITPMVSDQVGTWLDEYPDAWITDAIREAVLNNVRKPVYIETILKDWKTSGRNNGKSRDAPTKAKTGADYTGGQYGEFIDH